MRDLSQNENAIVRVMVVDDQPGYRRMVRLMLESEPDFVVVAEASNGHEAVALAKDALPHVIVMDVRMPVMDGFEAARRILDADPHVKIVLNSMEDSPSYPRMAADLGQAAFISKRDFTAERLRLVVRDMDSRQPGEPRR